MSALDEWTFCPLCLGVMQQTPSIRAIIDQWPSRLELAADLSASGDVVTLAQVNKWAQRQTIPARFWARIIRAAAARSISVTADQLVDLHDLADPAPSENKDAA